MTSDAPSFHRRVEEHTRCLCHDIKRLFYHHQRPHDLSSSTTPTKHANDKRKLIADTERWVICLEEQYQCRSGCNVIIIDALVSLLRTLDDVDVDNLQFLVNRYKGCSSRGKRVNDRKNQEPYDPSSASNKRQRRRLPPNIRSFEVVQALHDAEATIDSIDDDNNEQDVPTLYLSNSDRNKRAKKNTQLERHRGCSMMGISMKSILNVQTMPDEDGYGSQMPISTLTLDAAVLRRDLYKIIAACDIAEIKTIVEGEGSSSKTEKLQMEMKHLVTTLLNRITEHPNSPSLRLSAMVALDSIRELELSDWGYKCMLDELLAVGESWSIRFYAEIVSECHTYENPSRLLLGISTLMKQALKTHGKCLSTLLGAVSQILVRRQHLLSVLDQVEHCSSLLRSEKGIYNRVCHSMSIQFGSISDWVLPTMSSDDKESVISALRAVGIISFFCSEDGEDEIRHGAPQSSQRVEEHPFELPVCRSLRSAHDRLGPCDGFNLLISHPESYELRIISPLYSRKPPIPSLVEEEEEIVGPFSSASDDILTNVFTFLGFRSLARASQCCASWALAITAAPALWSKLYFKRYKQSRFEEELAVKTEASIANTYLRKFLSISSVADRQKVVAELVDDYDWKHLFAKKYGAEKYCKGETCCIIGCHYVHRRSDHVKSHMRR